MKPSYNCLLISDFNMDNFAAYLSNDIEWPKVAPIKAPYGQVIQNLSSRHDELKTLPIDMTVLWTRPDNMIESFNRLVNFEIVPIKQILEEVDLFCARIKDAKEGLGLVFIPTWVIPTYCRGFEMLDMKDGLGLKNSLMRMNLRLSENLSSEPDLYILDCDLWLRTAGSRSFNPKAWYLGCQ